MAAQTPVASAGEGSVSDVVTATGDRALAGSDAATAVTMMVGFRCSSVWIPAFSAPMKSACGEWSRPYRIRRGKMCRGRTTPSLRERDLSACRDEEEQRTP